MNYDCKLQNYPVIFKELLRSKLVTRDDVTSYSFTNFLTSVLLILMK